MSFLIDFYPGIPATHSFPVTFLGTTKTLVTSPAGWKKIHAMVKVDETAAKMLCILTEKFAFFDFDMYVLVMRTWFENGILCFNVFCISVIILIRVLVG